MSKQAMSKQTGVIRPIQEQPIEGDRHARYREISSRPESAAGARLQGFSRRRRPGQVAAAARLHLQGSSRGAARGRHLPHDVHQLLGWWRTFIRRRIPRARAEREAALLGQVRRSESQRGYTSRGVAEEGVGGNGDPHHAVRIAGRDPGGGVLPRLAGLADAARGAGGTRHSRLKGYSWLKTKTHTRRHAPVSRTPRKRSRTSRPWARVFSGARAPVSWFSWA